MGTAQPIRDAENLTLFIDYYKNVHPNLRNYTLIQLGLHTALRISDLLALRWQDVFDEQEGKCRTHVCVIEKKTQKRNKIALCPLVQETIEQFHAKLRPFPKDYIFSRTTDLGVPLSRSQAYRIVRTAAENAIHASHISCHSLRKTFGYHAWKQGVPPAMLMDIFNHSSYEVTKRYLGISQDERDSVFLQVKL